MRRQGNERGTVYERVTGLRDEAFHLVDEIRRDGLDRPQLLHELQTVANRLGEAERLSPGECA